jgi:hypothetical protein
MKKAAAKSATIDNRIQIVAHPPLLRKKKIKNIRNKAPQTAASKNPYFLA